jgi:asparagine synthase (glutamine-hydrolysing)
MCGIAVIFKRGSGSVHPGDIQAMTNAIAHRGPDDAGHILIDSHGLKASVEFGCEEPHAAIGYDVALGNRRLAILDLSPLGHQPMSYNGCTITYNGEIYNYLELAEELRAIGHRFLSRSDTEVLLHAYAEWGEDCLERLNGIFAFVIWDQRKELLFCARDRLGVKPLYYVQDSQQIILCSEIKGILAVLEQRPDLNASLLYDYLVAGRLDHTPETFFQGVMRLSAGCYLKGRNSDLQLSQYWSLTRSSGEFAGSFRENVERFRLLFHDAIRIQMRSDVPVACCLSGGLDSTSVASVASLFSSTAIKVFTARFRDPQMDEWGYAQSVHREKDVEAFFVFAEPQEFWNDLSRVVRAQEEPFNGPDVFAQWRLMKLVGDHGIRVLLDGQGGDELLCGYAKYFYVMLRELVGQRRVAKICLAVIDLLLHGGSYLFNLEGARRYVPWNLGLRTLGTKMLHPEFLARCERSNDDRVSTTVRTTQVGDIEKFTLPVLLRYEDKNSMAHSIESRVPFLDHRLVEFAINIPTDHKMRLSESKHILRVALGDEIPEAISRRRTKLGFGGSYQSWITELEPQIKSWLNAKHRHVDAFMCKKGLAAMLQRREARLFSMIILDAWMKEFHMS